MANKLNHYLGARTFFGPHIAIDEIESLPEDVQAQIIWAAHMGVTLWLGAFGQETVDRLIDEGKRTNAPMTETQAKIVNALWSIHPCREKVQVDGLQLVFPVTVGLAHLYQAFAAAASGLPLPPAPNGTGYAVPFDVLGKVMRYYFGNDETK